MPNVSEINCTMVLFNVELLLLFISASTPATAMYINPPAVNPCKKGNNKKSKLETMTEKITSDMLDT